MEHSRSIYRLTDLEGSPHPVLDAPYDSKDAALIAAKAWCDGQGLNSSLSERAIGVEVMTSNGGWRTVIYPVDHFHQPEPTTTLHLERCSMVLVFEY